jgi:hypothetical protein
MRRDPTILTLEEMKADEIKKGKTFESSSGLYGM